MPTFHLGQLLPVGDFSDIGHLRSLAETAESEEVEALYLEERRGRYFDPYVVLADIAQRDQGIILGICQPLDGTRAPSVLAKTLAGLDVCSGGRAAVALGALEDPSPTPAPEMPEALAIVRLMSFNNETTFSGKYFSVDRAWNLPRLTREHPPFVEIMPAFGKSQWTHELAHPMALREIAAQVHDYALCEVSRTPPEELFALVTHFRSQLAISSLIGSVLVEGIDETVEELLHLRDAGFVGALCRWPRLPDDKQLRELIARSREGLEER